LDGVPERSYTGGVSGSALPSCRKGTCTVGTTLPVTSYEQPVVSIESDPERPEARGLQCQQELVSARKRDDGGGRIPYRSLSTMGHKHGKDGMQ